MKRTSLERPAVVGDDQRFELVELGLGRLVARELQRPLEVVDAGPEGAVDVVGRALESERAAHPCFQPLAQRTQNAALADAGFAGEQHDLAFAVLRQLPALQQQRDLLLAPDQRRESFLRRGLEAACRFAHTHDAIGMGAAGDALQSLLAQVFIVEAAAGQAMHPLAHHDAARLRDVLQPGGQIHRLAHCALLRRGDDDESGRDADAHLQMTCLRNIELRQGVDDLQPRANGALGLAFVRQRIAEEGDDAITQALEHVALVAGYAHRAGILVAADDVSQYFGINARGQLGEPHHVAEQHGELTALACLARARGSGRGPQVDRRRRRLGGGR